MSACARPQPCFSTSCDHPPDCDHDGYGTEETPWRRMFQVGKVIREYPGGVFCKRCEWWLRDSPRPSDWPPAGVGSDRGGAA